jgi:hypothetical protein
MFTVRSELGLYISENGIRHSHRRENPQIVHELLPPNVATSAIDKAQPSQDFTCI